MATTKPIPIPDKKEPFFTWEKVVFFGVLALNSLMTYTHDKADSEKEIAEINIVLRGHDKDIENIKQEIIYIRQK